MITDGLEVLNVGLPLIVEALDPATVTQLDWRPPAFGDDAAARAALSLADERTRAANDKAMDAIGQGAMA